MSKLFLKHELDLHFCFKVSFIVPSFSVFPQITSSLILPAQSLMNPSPELTFPVKFSFLFIVLVDLTLFWIVWKHFEVV